MLVPQPPQPRSKGSLVTEYIVKIARPLRELRETRAQDHIHSAAPERALRSNFMGGRCGKRADSAGTPSCLPSAPSAIRLSKSCVRVTRGADAFRFSLPAASKVADSPSSRPLWPSRT